MDRINDVKKTLLICISNLMETLNLLQLAKTIIAKFIVLKTFQARRAEEVAMQLLDTFLLFMDTYITI